MTISTKIFNQQTIADLGRLSDQLGGLQDQVASGKKTIKPSIDPIATSKLHAAKDLQSSVQRYRGNVDRVESRLADSDLALSQLQNIMIRMKELSIQSSNGTLTHGDRLAIQKEVIQHKSAIVGIANSRDAQGQALFGGYQTKRDPFELSLNGSVSYNGDDGLHSLPVSSSLSIASGIDGISSFMRLPTSQGSKSIFEIVHEFEIALERSEIDTARANITSSYGAQLKFEIGPRPAPQTIRIEGPEGLVDVTADMVSGTMATMIAEVNKSTLQTGVQAAASDDGNTIVLTSTSNKPFSVSNLSMDGVNGAEIVPKSSIKLKEILGSGVLGAEVLLVDQDSGLSVSWSGFDEVIDHFALVQAQVGAYATTAEMQSEILARKELTVAEAISGIEDADLTAVVTELQSLLVNRDALRQVFAKVGQQSLFDLIR